SPYLQRVVTPAFLVFPHQRFNGLGAKDLAALYSLAAEQPGNYRPQLAIDPLRQWRIEAHFLSRQHLVRQHPLPSLPGYPFGSQVAHLHPFRDTRREFQKTIVGKRRPDFQRVGHGHAIGVLQTVATEKRSRVDITQAAERIEPGSPPEELAKKISRVSPADFRSKARRVHLCLLASGEVAAPVDIHVLFSLPGELGKLAPAAQAVAAIRGLAHQV